MRLPARLDSRQVVHMATGAALYGVFSWLTNTLALPSISLVVLRPAVVVPVFFGYSFGVRVGFFTGLVGNLIGDTLTGSGFYPTWDLGNGVLGALPGLARLGAGRRLGANAVAFLGAGGLVALAGLMASAREPLAGAPLLGRGWVPAEHLHWPLGLAALVLVTWLLARRQGPTAEPVLWGLFGIIGGIGAAALLDIPYSGLSFEATMIGQFLPAVAGNTAALLLLFPPLVRAYQRAQARAGR